MKKSYCDICGKELITWEDHGFLNLVLFQSCCNPLAGLPFSDGQSQKCTIEINDVCYTCQRELSSNLKHALVKRDVLEGSTKQSQNLGNTQGVDMAPLVDNRTPHVIWGYIGVSCPCGCGRKIPKHEAGVMNKMNVKHTTNVTQERVQNDAGRFNKRNVKRIME